MRSLKPENWLINRLREGAVRIRHQAERLRARLPAAEQDGKVPGARFRLAADTGIWRDIVNALVAQFFRLQRLLERDAFIGFDTGRPLDRHDFRMPRQRWRNHETKLVAFDLLGGVEQTLYCGQHQQCFVQRTLQAQGTVVREMYKMGLESLCFVLGAVRE